MQRCLFLCLWVLIGSVPLASAQTRTDTLDDATPIREYPLTVQNDGDTIYLEALATDGTLDPLLILVNALGVIVAEHDDISKQDNTAQIEYLLAPAGDYTVIVTRFELEDGDTSGTFALTMNVAAPSVVPLSYDVSDAALAAAGYPPIAPKPRAEWTILAYFGGDTNLEPGVMNDFNEFELAGGSDASVRVVSLMDRHPRFVTTSGDWRSARLFEVQADVSGDESSLFPPTLDTPPLADLGVIDTGSGETLALFLTWAIQSYPADHYAIALASHGGAWQGVITDDTNGNTILTLPELREAFAVAQRVAGGGRFDILINDACSMSSAEFHDTVKPFFETSLASPEVVIDPALNMSVLLETLRDDPAVSMETLAENLTTRYLADTSRTDRLDTNYLSYALTQLDDYDRLVNAIEAFAAQINTDPAKYTALIGAARSNTYTYSTFVGESSQIDLGDFMRQIRTLSTDEAIAGPALEVLNALSAVVVASDAAPRIRDRITYSNIYFPQNASDFRDSYPQVTPLRAWARMLRDYYQFSAPLLWNMGDALTAYHPLGAPTVRITRVFPVRSSDTQPPSIDVEIVGRRISDGAFTVDVVRDTLRVRLLESAIVTAVPSATGITYVNTWKNGVDRSAFQWMPFTLPTLSDGTTRALEPVTLRGEVASIAGRYRLPDDPAWYEVVVTFTDAGAVASVLSQSETGALASVEIAAGATFQTWWQAVADDGTTTRVPGTEYLWGADGITMTRQPTPDGVYDVGFRVRAFGGASGSDSVRLIVDNGTINTATRGYTALKLGATIQVPADWTDVVDYGQWLNTHNPDNTRALNVYYFEAAENIYDIARLAQERFGLVLTSELQTLTYRGMPGLYFDYTYQLVDGTAWRGRAFALYQNTIAGGKGIVYALEAPADAPDPTSDFREQLNRLEFINADDLLSVDNSTWGYRLFENTLPLPVRKGWDFYRLEDGWTRTNPPEGFEGLTFAMARYTALGDAAEIAQDVLTEQVPDATMVTTHQYDSGVHMWESVAYSTERNFRTQLGRIEVTPVSGRIYVTQIYDRTVVMWFEAPTLDALATFREIFEPMVDGFAPDTRFDEVETALARVRAIRLAEADNCDFMRWDTVCLGGVGQVVITDAAGDTQLSDPGAWQRIRNGEKLTLNSLDPSSVAVLNLQANLSGRNIDEALRIYVFEGVTVTNEAVRPPGIPATVQIVNTADQTIAIRSLPDSDSASLGSLAVGGVADAVALNADATWVRVRVPSREFLTGWVRADLVDEGDPLTTLAVLPISDADAPMLYPWQSLTVTFDDSDTFRGLILRASETDDALYIQLNGVVHRLASGAFVLWSADTQEFTNLAYGARDNVFDPTDDVRRPEAFIPRATEAAPERVPLSATPGA